jgi:hypothetical protein
MKNKKSRSRQKARARAISNGEIYTAGRNSRRSMFLNDWNSLGHDLPLIFWRAWVDTKARY